MPGRRIGRFRKSHRSYEQLLNRVVRAEHQGCILFTGRETPEVLNRGAVTDSAFDALTLKGITAGSAKVLLRPLKLSGTESDWKTSCNQYTGNPLAVKLAANVVASLFGGHIHEFLTSGIKSLDGIDKLIAWQLGRCSPDELKVVFRLATYRSSIDTAAIMRDMSDTIESCATIEALTSLRQRSIVIDRNKIEFGLPPSILDYVTSKLVSMVSRELMNGTRRILGNHPFFQMYAPDHVRDAQRRMVVDPILQVLNRHSGGRSVRELLRSTLDALRYDPFESDSYAAGNISNLLCAQDTDLSQINFSGLHLRNVDFREAVLHGADFSDAMR
jgi:hypothetical protein